MSFRKKINLDIDELESTDIYDDAEDTLLDQDLEDPLDEDEEYIRSTGSNAFSHDSDDEEEPYDSYDYDDGEDY